MSAFPDEPLDEIVVEGSDLAIASIVRSGAEAVTLLWSSEVTSTYTIQRSQPPSLWRLATGDWQILETDIPGQAMEMSRTLSGLSESAYYLRVATQ